MFASSRNRMFRTVLGFSLVVALSCHVQAFGASRPRRSGLTSYEIMQRQTYQRFAAGWFFPIPIDEVYATHMYYGSLTPNASVSSVAPLLARVHGGIYAPGTGVNNGAPYGERVAGGWYVPGQGVNNGFATPERVQGGWYVPGQGVNNGAPGATAVHGGFLIPGQGVVSHR